MTFILRKDNLYIAQIYHIPGPKTTANSSIDTENLLPAPIFTDQTAIMAWPSLAVRHPFRETGGEPAAGPMRFTLAIMSFLHYKPQSIV
jgi:hypothetical protein